MIPIKELTAQNPMRTIDEVLEVFFTISIFKKRRADLETKCRDAMQWAYDHFNGYGSPKVVLDAYFGHEYSDDSIDEGIIRDAMCLEVAEIIDTFNPHAPREVKPINNQNN